MTKRHAAILTLACASIALGCEAAPPAAPAASAIAAPRATAAPTAAPATAAPATAPPVAALTGFGDDEPPAPDAALPAGGVDSDLDAAESQAVEAMLATDDLRAFLPNDLIHDGGVALYRLAGLKDRVADATPAWSRVITTRGGDEIVLRKANDRAVHVVVRYRQVSTFSYRLAGELVTKKYGERIRRHLILRPAGGALQLAELSPIAVDTTGGRKGLEIERLAVYAGGAGPVYLATDDAATAPVAKLPTAAPGTDFRVEVDMTNKKAGDYLVFLSQPGVAPQDRPQLRDDGVAPDAVAGDFRFTGTLTAAAGAGLHHVMIDAIEPRSFLPKQAYRGYAMGMSYRVLAPAASR